MKKNDVRKVSGAKATVGSAGGRFGLKRPGLPGRILVAALAIVFCVSVLCIAYLISRTGNYYAVLDGAVITKTDFQAYKKDVESYISNQQGNDRGDGIEEDQLTALDPEKIAKEQLLMLVALEQEAKKQGLSVTPDDVDKALADGFSQLPEEAQAALTEATTTQKAEAVRAFRSERFKVSSDWVNKEVRIRLLQSRLHNILEYRLFTVVVIAASSEAEKIGAIDTLTSAYVPQLAQSISYAEVHALTRNSGEVARATVFSTGPMPDNRIHETFDEMAAAALSKITTPGTVSEPVCSEQTEGCIVARLEKMSNGAYESWDSYAARQVQHAHYFRTVFDWRRLVVKGERLN